MEYLTERDMFRKKFKVHNPFPNLHPPMLMETWQGRETIGWGLWRAKWFCICSKHHKHRVDCRSCCSGNYRNNFVRKIDHFVYVHWKTLWLWKHNRHLRKPWTLKLKQW